MMLGGERRTMDPQGAPRFHALYELDSPEVLLTDAWAKAVEQGRWPGQVRPHTSNRRHLLMRRITALRTPTPGVARPAARQCPPPPDHHQPAARSRAVAPRPAPACGPPPLPPLVNRLQYACRGPG
jgi:hypothetical protein